LQQENIFKFVALRPPVLIDDANRQKRFIYDPRPSRDSQVLKAVQSSVNNGETVETIVKKVKTLAKDAGYSPVLKDSQGYQKIKSIGYFIQNHIESYDNTNSEFVNSIESISGEALTTFLKNPDISSFRSRLWDTIYAYTIINREEPANLDESIGALRTMNVLDHLAFDQGFQDSDQLRTAYESIPVVGLDVFRLQSTPSTTGVRVLGFGDLKVVKQTLKKYTPGEIAYVENVLKGETRARKHRRLDKVEQTITTSTESVETSEKDLQSTDRSELKREAENTINEQMSLQAGVTVTANYGVVQLSAQGNFATSTARSESNRTSTNFAKEVIEKTVARIEKRIKEERAKKTITEIEETNDHVFNNGQGEDHITGVYRWLNKHYNAQVYNYGKRLMLEFIIPEPAAFYIYSQTHKPQEQDDLPEPQMPDIVDQNIEERRQLMQNDVSRGNYQYYVSKYRVQGVAVPPAETIIVGTAIDHQVTGEGEAQYQTNTKVVNDLQIPDGYTASKCTIKTDWRGNVSHYGSIIVGKTVFEFRPYDDHPMGGEQGNIPIAILVDGVKAYTTTIDVTCEITSQKFETWQMHTYNAIMVAYQVLKTEYEDHNAKKRADEQVEQPSAGNNPEINRSIEREELKKLCIAMMTGRNFEDPSNNVTMFRAMLPADPNSHPPTYPEIDFSRADQEGKIIQFFEQAIEWDQMIYLFYSYCWGRKENWLKVMHLSDHDPLFQKFLQAGSARVVVSIRRPYDLSTLYYIASDRDPSNIWLGGEPPTINDPLFLSVADEIRSQREVSYDAIPEGDRWEVVLPTDLVYLQKDSTLPDFTDQLG
jgi:hypothetical protein